LHMRPLRHRCARQAGRLIAREHREPRPACSPKVLYSAGHPTEAGACVHRECGRSSRSRLERETGLRRCLPLGKTADSTHCCGPQISVAGRGDSKLAASYWSSFWLHDSDGANHT
jgi:hypothetical protein